MGSRSIELKSSVEDAFLKIQVGIGNSGFKVNSIVPNQTIIAEGTREFSWLWVIILALILWPAAIVYYFTRHRSSVTVTTSKTEAGCTVTIISNGNAGDVVLQLIVDTLHGELGSKENDSGNS